MEHSAGLPFYFIITAVGAGYVMPAIKEESPSISRGVSRGASRPSGGPSRSPVRSRDSASSDSKDKSAKSTYGFTKYVIYLLTFS